MGGGTVRSAASRLAGKPVGDQAAGPSVTAMAAFDGGGGTVAVAVAVAVAVETGDGTGGGDGERTHSVSPTSSANHKWGAGEGGHAARTDVFLGMAGASVSTGERAEARINTAGRPTSQPTRAVRQQMGRGRQRYDRTCLREYTLPLAPPPPPHKTAEDDSTDPCGRFPPDATTDSNSSASLHKFIEKRKAHRAEASALDVRGRYTNRTAHNIGHSV